MTRKVHTRVVFQTWVRAGNELRIEFKPLLETAYMAGSVLEITDSTFENDVLKSQTPVLVDFWAAWCGPCRMIAPLVEELATENDGSAKVTKLNVDDSPATAQSYGVSSIPTIVIFKNGEELTRLVGVKSKSEYQQALDEAKG